ncbi:aminoglycoside phosphotransferase (APT) family kinase protein [Micromonospora profundi]|uniref:phosphotransferase n=1 Tax=Micromonospora profundi TaxID=1420889 RepID=UPI00143896C8|nr:phosphotransferase [Micromonospora profundi]NJC12944.1 aminoglycoside phosphotransferase (APT) family kinase protein [Micromonospora profundi]
MPLIVVKARRANVVRTLHGGYLNGGRIKRVANKVVRRQGHRWPLAVEEALGAMARRGFTGCPRQIRRIDSCSVILTYMPGFALPGTLPRWAAQPSLLTAVTRFMQRFSFASAGIRQEIRHADWLAPPMSDGDAFVHGDPHPTNIVLNGRRDPTAIVDFELSTVGTHDWNLISLVFAWAPLEPIELTSWERLGSALEPAERAGRILRQWGSSSSAAELLETGRAFVEWRKRWIRRLAHEGNPGARQFLADPLFDARYASVLRMLRAALR